MYCMMQNVTYEERHSINVIYLERKKKENASYKMTLVLTLNCDWTSHVRAIAKSNEYRLFPEHTLLPLFGQTDSRLVWKPDLCWRSDMNIVKLLLK